MTEVLDFDLSKPKCNPRILLDSGPPRALYKINPRLILGKERWDEIRRWVYKNYDNKCAACGKSKVRLEAHEMYHIDKQKGILRIKDIVPLCFDCHMFVHQDLHKSMLSNKELTYSDIVRIMAHGTKILKKYKIRNVRKDPNGSNVKPDDWLFVFNGEVYNNKGLVKG